MPAQPVKAKRPSGTVKAKAPMRPAAQKTKAAPTRPALLSGGNPQIPKGDGDAPVQAYIAAIPDWKQALARRLDALITRTVPKVRKAVKWNSPFYGMGLGMGAGGAGNDGPSWFLSFHCFNKYLKVTFFNGVSLKPPPPGPSKHKDVRYLDIRQDDAFDQQQFVDWLRQASKLPGWTP